MNQGSGAPLNTGKPSATQKEHPIAEDMRQASINIDDNVVYFQTEPFPAVIRGTVEKIGMDITVNYLEYLTRPTGEKETSLSVPPASLLVITELPYSSVSGNIGTNV